MKALFTLQSAKKISLLSAMLVLFAPLFYPEIVLATTGTQIERENQPLVFEIKSSDLIQKAINPSLSFDSLMESDPLADSLRAYLEEHNSPLAQYSEKIIQLPQWQRALAISWVESNFGIHCADNNCSGIGVAPGHPSWRRYPNKLEWFKDMTSLLETPRYKDTYTTFERMRGIYVYPGSNSWVYGAKTKYAELMALTKEAEEQRQLAAQNSTIFAAANGKLELAELTR